MMRRMIIGGICVIVMLFSGVGLESFKQKDSKDVVVETEDENVVINELENEVATEETKEKVQEEQENIVDSLEQNENIDATTQTDPKQDNKGTDNKNEGNKPTTTNTDSNKIEEKPINTGNTNQNQEKPKIPENNKEEAKQEQKTEEYIYNKTETNKLIADIDEIAKRNKDLWGANGEKLYSVEICQSLMGQNYMYPYNYSQVEGKVLNVYSVTFLVYAVDYKKPGFATQTRYYIDITSFKK